MKKLLTVAIMLGAGSITTSDCPVTPSTPPTTPRIQVQRTRCLTQSEEDELREKVDKEFHRKYKQAKLQRFKIRNSMPLGTPPRLNLHACLETSGIPVQQDAAV